MKMAIMDFWVATEFALAGDCQRCGGMHYLRLENEN
jgi:hypothetical protein